MLDKAYKILSINQNISHNKAKSLIDAGLVSANGQKIILARTLLDKNTKFSILKQEKPKIIFEDNDILAVDKPPFMASSEIEKMFKFKLLNRLDKGTSGVIMLSKNEHFRALAISEFEKLRVKKIYLAIVKGIISEKFSICEPILSIKSRFSTTSIIMITKMIKKDIFLISMHTNFDKYVLNSYFVSEILGLKIDAIKGFVAYVKLNQNFDDFVKFLAKKLNLNTIKAVKTNSQINTLAICVGSGADLISEINADCFLTGDLKYHTALQCYENKLSLIDVGHFETERYFGLSLASLLQKKQIKAIIQSSINPFNYYEGIL